MFLKIFLCSSIFVVVYANNVIPVQTYPVYQQNGYIMNPTVNQPSNYNPYNSGMTVQNQLQQLNISPSSIKQALLNKLLAGAPVQVNLGPSAQSYGTNLRNVQNNQIPNNLVSNHVAIPTEYWKNKVNDNNDKVLNDSRNNIQHNQGHKKKLKSKRSKKDEDLIVEKSTIDQQIKNKKNCRKENIQSARYTEDLEQNSPRNKNSRTRRRKKKEKEDIKESPVVDNIEENEKRPRKKKSKVKEQGKERNNPENVITNKTKQSSIKENIELDITNDGMDNENRKARNSKQELIEAPRSISNIPPEITNHYLTNMNQLNNPLMSNWFANYENLYKSFLANQTAVTTESKPKRKKKNKRTRKNKRKKNNVNRNSTVETTNNNSSQMNPDYTTTELYPDPIVESFKPFETDERSLKYSSNEIFRDGYNLNEFDDVYESGPYDGYINDYYPLFTDNAAYTANNKEVILKNLNDDKYFYATDETTQIPKKHIDINYDLFEETTNDYEENTNKSDDIDKETVLDNYINVDNQVTETYFRSPPFLESPDFETRQIDRSEIKPAIDYTSSDSISRYVGDKSFSAKTANFNGFKKNDIKTPSKDIETVYAKSKVAAYGPVYIPGDADSDAHDNPWIDSFESNSYQSDGTTYIVAKSFNDEEVW